MRRHRLAGLLARHPRVAGVAHLVPGLRGPIGRLAENEYRSAVEAEREARGIRLPRRGDGRCVWCGATRLHGGPKGAAWMLDAGTQPMSIEQLHAFRDEAEAILRGCPGHETVEEAEARLAADG